MRSEPTTCFHDDVSFKHMPFSCAVGFGNHPGRLWKLSNHLKRNTFFFLCWRYCLTSQTAICVLACFTVPTFSAFYTFQKPNIFLSLKHFKRRSYCATSTNCVIPTHVWGVTLARSTLYNYFYTSISGFQYNK